MRLGKAESEPLGYERGTSMSERDPTPAAAAAHVLGLWTVAVAHPLTDKLSDSGEFFVARQSDPLDIVLFLGALYAAAPLALWLVVMLVRKASPRAAAWAHGTLVVLLVLLTAAPMAHGAGLPGYAAIAAGGVVAALFAVGWWRSRQLRESLVFLAVAPVLSIGLFVSSIAPLLRADVSHEAARAAPSAPVDVVIVLLDELPLSALLDERLEIDAARFPNFGELAATSTWFRRATAVSTHTVAAVPALLTGRYPTDGEIMPTVGMHPQNLFTLLHPAYRMNVEERMSQLCPLAVCESSLGRGERLASLLADTSAVYLNIVVPDDIDVGLPRIDGNWGGFWGSVANQEQRTRRIDRFTRIVRGITAQPDPTLHFSHHIVPHMPYQFLPSGKTYPAQEEPRGCTQGVWGRNDYALQQGYQQLLLQLQFTDHQLGRILDKLETEGILDGALVVVTADHGASFEPRTHRRGDPKSKRFYEEMLQVPLFVKLPGQTVGSIDDRPVETIDILPTIAERIGLEIPEPVDGQSLFASDWRARPTKRVAVQPTRPARRQGPRTFDVVEVEVPSAFPRVALDWKLERFGTGTTRGLFEIGPAPELLGRPVGRVGEREDCTVELHGRIGGEWQEVVRFESSAGQAPVHVLGTVSCGSGAPPKQMAAVIDGKIVATTFTWRKDEKQHGFELLWPEEALVDGDNALMLVAIGPGPALQRLRLGPG